MKKIIKFNLNLFHIAKQFFIIFLLIAFFQIKVNYVSAAGDLRDAFIGGAGYLKTAAETGAGYKAGTSVESLTSIVLTTVLSLLGVIFLILMVYGGYLWMTARGNEDQVKKAKSLITDTIIGLIIVLMAYAISWFIISKMGGPTLK